MTRRCSLAHLPALEITGADGARFCGADQDWYRTVWQQRAGCGPTTASVLLAYLCLKLYDEPVRRLLTRRFLPTRR